MALLGASIDPSLFRQDYSGFVNAAKIEAGAMAGLGQTIAGSIQKYGEAKQERKKLDAGIKASVTGIESAIKMGKSLGIDIESGLAPYLQKINDPNISPVEAAAYAKEASSSISNAFNLGMKGREIDVQEGRYAQQAEQERNRYIESQKPDASKWTNYNEVINIEGRPIKVVGQTDQYGGFKDLNGNQYPNVGMAFSYTQPTTEQNNEMVLPDRNVPTPSPTIYFNAVPSIPGDVSVPQPVVSPDTVNPNVVNNEITMPAGSSYVEQKRFRPFNAEEAKLYGSQGQVDISENRVYPITPPSGTSFKTNPDGSVEYISGAGVSAKTEKSEENKIDKAIALTQDLNLLEDRMQSMAPGVAGAVGRIAAENIPGTFQAENKEVINRVVATLTLENLQAMRSNSPTGAALGNVSDKDTGLMRDSATSLRNAQSPEQFKRELVRLKNLQHDVVYGSERVLKNKLSKGEIDKSQFDAAMAAAPFEYLDDRGVITTRPVIPATSSGGVGLDQGARDVLQEFKKQ